MYPCFQVRTLRGILAPGIRSVTITLDVDGQIVVERVDRDERRCPGCGQPLPHAYTCNVT